MSNSTKAAQANDGIISDMEVEDIISEGSEKFGYVAEKDPSPKMEFYAATITALTGIQVTPKQYQAMISTHRYIQASDLNRARPDYRPRTADSVLKAASTLLEAADDLLRDDAGAVISKSSTSIPADLIPESVLNNFRVRQEEPNEAEDEPVDAEDDGWPEDEPEEAAPAKKRTKAEIIDDIIDVEELAEGSPEAVARRNQLKKMTVKKLEAVLLNEDEPVSEEPVSF